MGKDGRMSFDQRGEGLVSSSSSSSGSSVGLWGLVAIAFFWVSGGVYGNETLVMAAPSYYVFVGLIIVPLVYSLPIALITAELSTAMPADGGFGHWVRKACGARIGMHNAYWVWIIWLVDSSVYPVLASHFISNQFKMPKALQSLVADIIIVSITMVKLTGTKAVVRLSSVISAVSFVPTVIYMLVGIPKLETKELVERTGEVDWPLLLSWMLWLYSGFFSMGSLAGQVRDPQKTYVKVTGVLIPFVMLLNIWPLAVSLSIDNDRDNYNPGHFNDLAGKLAGNWLKFLFLIASNLCQVGLYTGQSLTSERALAHLVESASGKGDSWLDRVLRMLPDTLTEMNDKAGIAPLYVMINACIAAILAWFPVTSLVEYEMMLMSLVALLFLYSFVKLRITEPDMPRPFRLRGGTWMAIGWIVIPTMITLVNLGFQLFGGDDGFRTHVPAFISVLLVGGLAHFAWHLEARKSWTRASLFRKIHEESRVDLEESQLLTTVQGGTASGDDENGSEAHYRSGKLASRSTRSEDKLFTLE